MLFFITSNAAKAGNVAQLVRLRQAVEQVALNEVWPTAAMTTVISRMLVTMYSEPKQAPAIWERVESNAATMFRYAQLERDDPKADFIGQAYANMILDSKPIYEKWLAKQTQTE